MASASTRIGISVLIAFMLAKAPAYGGGEPARAGDWNVSPATPMGGILDSPHTPGSNGHRLDVFLSFGDDKHWIGTRCGHHDRFTIDPALISAACRAGVGDDDASVSECVAAVIMSVVYSSPYGEWVRARTLAEASADWPELGQQLQRFRAEGRIREFATDEYCVVGAGQVGDPFGERVPVEGEPLWLGVVCVSLLKDPVRITQRFHYHWRCGSEVGGVPLTLLGPGETPIDCSGWSIPDYFGCRPVEGDEHRPPVFDRRRIEDYLGCRPTQ